MSERACPCAFNQPAPGVQSGTMARVRSAAAAALLAVAAVLVLRVWRGHAPGLGGAVSEPTDSYGAARPRSTPRSPADGAAWLDDDAAAHAAWRPRWQWPDPRSTLPAVVDVVQWSARPEWRRSLFRRAHPALIQGSPAGQWPALERWRHPGQGEHHVCSVVDTLPNVMTPSEHASPANTFFYLNPNGAWQSALVERWLCPVRACRSPANST